ncbi:MAG TPA: PD-(D/E)XK nuclease family protein, partial [Ktedonobacteraceae bacterium]|nr:PD-(D/E)XK nuclease family protein [Ktedonobacteraceae bacterium]
MATLNDQYFDKHDEIKRECFLCTLDPKHSCHEAQLEGRIVAAQERLVAGERTPIVILDTGTARVEVRLYDQYYRSLIRELKARGDVIGTYNLTLRIYHLPVEPFTIEYKEHSRQCYQTNTYTLAVLEPDTLLNITDLNQAEYCPRQYILNRLIPSKPSAATLRGNLIHHCFKELLKEHDRGRFNPQHSSTDKQSESPLASLHHHLEQALDLYSIDIALADISSDGLREEVAPHLESLAQWYEQERNTLWDMPTAYANQQGETNEGNQVRAETFLLAPEIGLRGRLDLFWQQAGRQRLLELKTGGASGDLPKRDHRWQVYGYHALLTVRRDSKMKKALATLLYSGTPGSAQAFGIPASIREIQRVNETRNILILSRVTNIPTMPPGPGRCTKCAMLTQCQRISSILYWQPPEPDPQVMAARQLIAASEVTQPHSHMTSLQSAVSDTSEDRDFFARYYRLLQMEGRAGELQQARLWQTPVAERIQQGTAIRGLEIQDTPTIDKDGWVTVFHCQNTSELREGDEILLSNGDPITGEVVTGTIMAISSEQVTVWTRELIAHPTLIDRYDNDLVHIRTLQNLLRWLQADAHLRDL